MLEKVLLLIEKYFKGKVDKAGKPYINHLIAVSEQVKSEEDKVVALLHDIIEDTDISIEELNKIIPMNLIGRILVLTHDKKDTYEEYINNILNCGDIHVIRIKMADMWHNMDLSRLNTITNKDIQRFQKYRVYYKKLEKKYIQILEKNKEENDVGKILDNPKEFFDYLSEDELVKLLDYYGFEYKNIEQACKRCFNYNVGDGIDDVRQCYGCKYQY